MTAARQHFAGTGFYAETTVRPGQTFDNSSNETLRVPGFGGIAVDVVLPDDERFAHGFHDWAQPRLTGREPENIAQGASAVALEKDFRALGLQVVVRVNSIELTPESPTYDVPKLDIRHERSRRINTCQQCDRDEVNMEYAQDYGEWYVDGTLNEHIVATTVICVSSQNATPYHLLLQVEADLDPELHRYEHDNLAAIYDVWPPTALEGTKLVVELYRSWAPLQFPKVD